MQLRSARLCLDCDEVHDAQQCPQCASETFAFITRWVPVPDRPQPTSERPAGQLAKPRTRTPEASSPEALGAYREMLNPGDRGGKWKTIRRGAVGLALFGIAGWMWRNNNRPEGEAADQARDDETVDQQRP
jgi:hypothetical protein